MNGPGYSALHAYLFLLITVSAIYALIWPFLQH